MEEHVKVFAERLKGLREEKNLTLAALAQSTGLGVSTLSQYENGEREVKTVNLLKLMKFFNVTADYLLGATDVRNSIK
jgi:transcriptional regulator with XRE-family HTH domain